MAELAIAAGGAWLGSSLAASAGVAAGSAVAFGMTGAQLGWMGGSILGSLLFPPKVPDGPRLQDLTVQSSAYGQPIPILYGTARMAGNVIWATDLQEHANEEGGKGGPSYTTYSYTCSFSVSFCEGPVDGIRRIWADGKLIYDSSATNDGPQKGFTASAFTIYLGDETQLVDPTIEAHMASAPAYRGLCYVVFDDLQLEKYGNRIPNLTAEVVQNGTYAPPPPDVFGPTLNAETLVMHEATGFLWQTATAFNTGPVYVTDPVSKTLIESIDLPYTTGDTAAEIVVYCPPTDSFWYASAGGSFENLWVVSAAARAVVYHGDNGTGLDWFPRVYNPARSAMVVTDGSVIKEVSPVTYAATGASIGSVGSTYCNGGLHVADHGLLFIPTLTTLCVIDAVDFTLIDSIVPGNSVFRESWELTYDPDRERVVWLWDSGTTAQSLAVIDLPTLDVSYHSITDGDIDSIHYSLTVGAYFATLRSGDDDFIAKLDPDTWAFLDTYPFHQSNDSYTINQLIDAPGLDDRLYSVSDEGTLIIYLTDRLTPAGIPLSDVVTDLSERVALTPDQLDVTTLTDIVDGFVVSRQGTARSQIEQLMMAYQFDAVESGSKVKFVKRGRQAPVVIDADDLSAHEPGSDLPAPLPLTRADEVELPHTINIRYINAEADYQTGTQYARRLTGRAEADSTADLPIVLSDAHAKAVADAALYSAWVGRTKASWSTTLKHAAIEPTDIVSIDGNLIRVTTRQLQGNRIAFEGAFESGAVYLGTATGSVASITAQTISHIGNTALFLMDIPPLRDWHSENAFYIAASGYGPDWPGCVVYKSIDDGATWSSLATITQAAKAGAATTALAAYTGTATFDSVSTVTVRLLDATATLSSTTEANVLLGVNACLIGDEILGFTTATLVSAGVYTLSGLLRYQRGTTEVAHSIGDRFVLLEDATVKVIEMSAEQVGLPILYKAVTIGKTLASATAIEFTNTANGATSYMSYVSASGPTYATATSISSTTPTVLADDDALFAIVFARSTLTPPAGWTLVDSSAHSGGGTSQVLYVYRKDTVAAADANVSTTWSQASSARMGVAYVAARSSTGTVTVAESSPRADSLTGASPTSVPIDTLTSAAASELFLLAVDSDSSSGTDTWTAPSGATLRTTASASGNRLAAATQRSSAAAQNSGSPFTYSSNLNMYTAAITLRLVATP